MTTSREKKLPLILIADDDKFTRVMLRKIMEKHQYRVEEAENGEECIAAYKQLQPDMVLLDGMMPVMDGFTCCRELQKLSGEANIPVLMITGLNDQASVDWAFAAGAIDYVTKPIHPPVLSQRVDRILKAHWAERALRESEKQYRSVVENVKEAIFTANIDASWTFLNHAWTEMTGFTVAESLGTNLFNYIHPEDSDRCRSLWDYLVTGKVASFQQELRYLTKTGKDRWMEIHAYEITDSTDRSISGMLQDITERRQAEALAKEKIKLEADILEQKRTAEMMRNSLEKEKELGSLRTRIITRISHEFRTPLTVIMGSTQLLKKATQELLEERKLKHFFNIEHAIGQMLQMLEDALVISDAESGNLTCNPTMLDVEAIARELVEELQQKLNGKHTVELSVRGKDTHARLDEKLLRLILSNLLSNAVKYSPQGGLVNLDAVCEGGQGIFRIQDRGIGIPPEDRERLFESFYRSKNADDIQGTGLGLAIVKKSVDLHRGEIAVESQVNVGTTFTVKLPLH